MKTKKPGRQPVTPGERVVSITVSVTVAQHEWLRAHGAAKTVRKLVAAAMEDSLERQAEQADKDAMFAWYEEAAKSYAERVGNSAKLRIETPSE